MKRLLFQLFLLSAASSLFAGTATLVSAQTIQPSCVIIPTSLSIGSHGDSVTSLQTFLHAEGFLGVQATGYFGALTSAAVSNFQASVGLPPVGMVGPLTRAAIQKASCPQASGPSMGPAPITTNSNGSTTTTPTASLIINGTTTPDISSTTASVAASTTASAATSTASSTDAALPYKADTFYDWKPVWGQVTVGTTTGILELAGGLDNNGAEAVFPKSLKWTDYRYTANISVANGNISLIARYVDGNNFLSCSFSSNWVELDQTSDGTTTVLASQSINGILSNTTGATQTTSVAMDVQGNTVGCAGYGPQDNVTYTIPSGAPMSGGIGVESWYATPLADKLDLLSVQVTPL